MADALSSTQLLQTIYDALKTAVEAAHGQLSIARDPLDIIEQLGQAPGAFRCILSWNGEKQAPGTHRDSGVVEHSFHIVVSHNRGLSILKGETMYLTRDGQATPLVELNALVRDAMRRLRFTAQVTEEIARYVGSEPVAVDGTAIDAFTQTWTLLAALTPASA